MRLMVVGTDTDIGKTLVSSLIMARYQNELPLKYCKPIATGTVSDTVTVQKLAKAQTLPEVYHFNDPVSPHLAAQIAKQKINLNTVVKALNKHEHILVEGIGGVLVPLNQRTLFIDLMTALNWPVVLVASSRVGTINHTLLTLQALRAKNIEPVGVIVNGSQNKENCKAIEHFGKTRVLAEVLPIKPLNSRTLQKAAEQLDFHVELA